MAGIAHVVVGAAAGHLHVGRSASWKKRGIAMLSYSTLSMLPDADVLAFSMGIPYEHPWGHRGATHSLLFAAVMGLVFGGVFFAIGHPKIERTLLFCVALATAVTASHGLLDTLTDGGLGAALFYPFDNARHFAPWRPLAVSPIGRRIFSARGLELMAKELLLFSPLLVYALLPRRKTDT